MSEMCEGQYMGARWYGISSWVFNLISSSWAREEKFKHTNDHFFHDFRKISEHFPKISEDSLEVGGRPKNLFRKFPKRFPKITEDFRETTDDVSIIQEHNLVPF